jgi:membrane protein required for colicin V production
VSVFDLIILAILAALTLRGIWKGMISQIVSIASFFICWIVATRFGGLIAPTIPVEAPWNQVIAMGIIFFVALIAIRFAHSTLEKLIKDWHLQKMNTLFGGLLGFAKGLLICLIITFFAVMFSETSRAVVFNSKSGFHLTQLITRIGVFVPTDSYEFVHTQLAQFQDKVDGAVPGQTPETIPIQSSETMQKMLSQLQQSDKTTETHAGSLMTALSKWWNGSKDKNSTGNATETSTGTTNETPQSTKSSASSSLPAATYTPSASPPASSLLPPVNSYTDVPQQGVSLPTVAVDDFFVQRPAASVPSVPLPQLSALSSSITEKTAPLTTLAPLAEALSMLPESIEILPTILPSNHVGSDLLLRNSTLPTNPSAEAKVFRP